MLLAFLLPNPAWGAAYSPTTYLPSAAAEPARTGELAVTALRVLDGSSAWYMEGAWAPTDRLRLGGSLGVGLYDFPAPPTDYWMTLAGRYNVVQRDRLNLAIFGGTGYLLEPAVCFFSCGTLDDVFFLTGVAAEGPIGSSGRLRFDVSVPVMFSHYFGNFGLDPALEHRLLTTPLETEAGVSLGLTPKDRLRFGKGLDLCAVVGWMHSFGTRSAPRWFFEVDADGGYITVGLGGATAWADLQLGRAF